MASQETLIAITLQSAQPPSVPQFTENADKAREFHAAAIQHFKIGSHEEARCSIVRSLRLVASSVRWNDFATIMLACNDLHAAEVGYRQAVELDPANTQAARNLLSFLLKLNKAATAPPMAPEEVKQFLDSLNVNDLDGIVAGICALSLIDSTAPRFFQEAIGRGLPYTGYFVRQALEMLAGLTEVERLALIPKIDAAGERNPRCQVLSAVLHMMQLDYAGAAPRLRAALSVEPEDLFASDALLECLCLSPENGAENIAARQLQKYLLEHTCSQPWTHVEVTAARNVHLCCPSRLPLSIGNIAESSADQMWHSEAAEAVRASILDGSFRFCNKTQCLNITSRTLPPKSEETFFIPVAELKDAAARVTLSYDFSCNLACPQCRRDFMTATRAEQEAMDKEFMPWVEGAVALADTLFLNGSGDVFGSKHSRALLGRMTRERYPSLKFEIITNGQLFDQRAYHELDLAGRIDRVKISIDAATSETYNFVRRGGSFDRLMINLAFLDGLRNSAQDSFALDLLFVVSVHNYREMPAFVRLAKTFHADTVAFTMVRATSGLTPKEVREWSVFDPGHALYPDLLKVMQAPELKDSIVISSLSDLIDAAPA